MESVSDFGLNGKSPSHPELLDWLAAELIEHGWSMKHLHRLMVTSATYRMQSTSNPKLARVDAENRWYWRAASKRMEAEVVRDSLLATASWLDLTQGGAELDDAQSQSIPRRSLYFRTTPDNKSQLLEIFDLANPNACYRRQSQSDYSSLG